MGCGGLSQMPVNQFFDLLTVFFRTVVAQFFFEGLTQRFDVTIFTKHQGNHQPVISRTDLPIFAVVAIEGALMPALDIGGRPFETGLSPREVRRVMLNVPRAQQAAPRNRLPRASN